jgi:hypothetical protein
VVRASLDYFDHLSEDLQEKHPSPNSSSNLSAKQGRINLMIEEDEEPATFCGLSQEEWSSQPVNHLTSEKQ